ncbi:MAG: hypothetical protein CVV33_00760, partial [Methanomicrobiales archaeon HGW-Methanomicrobiales-4]
SKTVMFVGTQEKVLGLIAVRDEIRPDAKAMINQLHKMGIATIMLTGDNYKTAWAVAIDVDIDDVRADLKPEEKAEAIKSLKKKYGSVVMIGDGINDAPAFITGMIDLRGVITTIIDLRVLMNLNHESTGKKRSRVIVLDKTVTEKMIGILVDDVSSVTTYTKDDIDQDAQSSSESHRDIIGVIRKHRKDGGGKDKSTLVIWLDIKKMIGRVEKDL